MDLIVVGSSAGGIDALSVLVASLPENFPAPLVIAQHLDPTRSSSLDVILQRRTTLPVEVVTDYISLQSGHIYVVPSNRHVVIRDHHVELLEESGKRPRPSVDTLLSTAAEFYGERLIAVILTGSGSDGARGAIDVKNTGGTVVVQNPQTARYPSMPLALPPTIVDFEVDLEKIGPLLSDLVMGISVPPSEDRTENTLHQILDVISRQASIDFRPYKTSTILRRVNRRMIVTHNRNMRDYLGYLQIHSEEVTELVNSFLINVTQFFRDPEAFMYLRDEILPRLIAQASERDRVLRFWAAGCATGEEPYSLAMLITDLLGAELSRWSIKIFATDLDEPAINFARRGLYSENLLKGVSQEYRERFFERVENGLRISKTLRQMVIFGQQDLSRSAPFPRIDLVLCRNVLIYFTPELQDYVLNQFAFSLSPHGYLFLGKAETVRPAQTFYELVNKHWKVYRCIGNALPSLRRQTLAEINNTHRLGGHIVSRQHSRGNLPEDQESPNLSFELGQLRRFNELMLRFLPIGVVVIDRNYHLLSANGMARRLLGLREVASEQDFLHAIRGVPYHEIRTSIDLLFRERNSLNLPEVELDAMNGGNGRFVSLSLALMQVEATFPELAIISVTDVTQQVQTRRQLETAQEEQSQLMHELSTANKRLSDVNKDLMDANEELQVANEELMLTHEELQASIEEFETTNEELQATNEELETNNEELQATNEELETTNDELRARTGELQELAIILETERGRLAQMVELAPFYILLLRGPSLIVEAYNPRYARLLENRTIQGRPLDEVIDLFWEGGVEIVHLARDAYRLDEVRAIRRVLTHLVAASHNAARQEAYVSYTVVPSHDPSGKVDGVLIYALDETEERLRQADEERERFRLIFDNFSLSALALFDASSGQFLIGSSHYLEYVARAKDISRSAVFHKTWHELAFFVSPEEANRLWQQALTEQRPIQLSEFSFTFPDDATERIWDYVLTPLLDTNQQDHVLYMVSSLVDITEQVVTRQKIEQLDGLKDEFLSLATHELRTPLTSIKGNAQLLRRALGRRAQQQADLDMTYEMDLLERVSSQTDRINRMIVEMFDVARMNGQAFELHATDQVDLVALTHQVVEEFRGLDDDIRFETSTDTLVGRYDADRIAQILQNLVSNAVKYSPPTSPVYVSLQRRADDVLFSIRDEGQGIAPEDLTHIFDRFYRAQNSRENHVDGLGLGLYIAYEIVERHGGRMWCESTPGQGSTFFFTLPVQ